jgi:DNA invertase Pin-like site-specific DNA recombinase
MTARTVGQKAQKSRSGAPGGPLRVYGYIRVSTEEQGASGAGLESQRQAIEAACHDRGYELVETYQDVASAKSLDRPELTACLALLDAHKADALVVAKLDRLSRSLLDFASLMERSRRKGWAVVALDLGVDSSTPAGEMLANVLATFAHFERRLIGQRTKDALAVKREQGVKLGRPRNLPDDVVARILRDHEAGQSYSAIARALTEECVKTAQGGTKWYPSVVRHVVSYATREAEDGPEIRTQTDPNESVPTRP